MGLVFRTVPQKTVKLEKSVSHPVMNKAVKGGCHNEVKQEIMGQMFKRSPITAK